MSHPHPLKPTEAELEAMIDPVTYFLETCGAVPHMEFRDLPRAGRVELPPVGIRRKNGRMDEEGVVRLTEEGPYIAADYKHPLWDIQKRTNYRLPGMLVDTRGRPEVLSQHGSCYKTL